MDLLNKINFFLTHLNDVKHGDLVNFTTGLSTLVESEIEKLETLCETLRTQSSALLRSSLQKRYTVARNEPTQMICKVGGAVFEAQKINSIHEATKYPGIPCIFADVPGWYFIHFAELGQTLPVQAVPEFMNLSSNERTKLHYGVMQELPHEALSESTFAVIPFNRQTWNYFIRIDRKHWNGVLKQMAVRFNPRTWPLQSTAFLAEQAPAPEDMCVMWSTFVQLYFMLFLFKKSADSKHFLY